MSAVLEAPHRGPRGDYRRKWRDASPRTRSAARVAILLVLVLAAYHYSLLSLVHTLNQETPLAYVGLAPPMALVIAWLRSRTAKPEPAIHDRQVDYIVGLPLLAVAIAINLVFPHRLATMFWVWRIDLFSLPFFVAGAVSVVFGVRALWRQRLAIAFLFLAWPVPYNLAFLRFLDRFTAMTLWGVHHAVRVAAVAKPLATDGSIFEVVHRGHAFEISVVSACSGVNGMVGFLLVGVAFAAIVRGPRLLKALWLTGGLGLLWVLNLLRIVFIFWAGQTWGEKVAIDVFHPFVGLVTFNAGIVLMLLFLRRFRLSIDGTLFGSRPGVATAAQPSSVGNTKAPAMAVPRVRVALTIVALLGGLLAVTNAGLKSYDIVANALGVAKLASFSDFPATPDGWRAEKAAEYDWAKPYFGAGSTWLRYTMFPGTANDLPLRSSQPVTADVVSTGNIRSFSAYGIEACYRFHGYKLRDVAAVDLGSGISGQALSFLNEKAHQDWTVVYWVWPVRTSASTRYERVVLYLQNSGQTSFTRVNRSDGVHSVLGGLTRSDAVTTRLASVRSFLVEFARQVIRNQAVVRPGTLLPAANNSGPTAPNRLTELLRARQQPSS